MKINENYGKFMKYIKEYIKRDGIDRLITYLEHTDFKIAPASSKYHMSVEGGLVQHSLNVFMRMIQLIQTEYGDFEHCPYTKETIALVSLLHDIAKVNFYKIIFKNVKNDETGVWEKVQSYGQRDEDERFNFSSHEENCLYMLSKFFKLSYEEELAVRFHMGHTEYTNIYDAYGAYKRSPLALMLHIADIQATYLDESENAQKMAEESYASGETKLKQESVGNVSVSEDIDNEEEIDPDDSAICVGIDDDDTYEDDSNSSIDDVATDTFSPESMDADTPF